MRRIAIVGGGQTGLICGIALLAHGYEVTIYSDRTAEDWLERSVPTGLAGIQSRTVGIERSHGLAFWEKETPDVEGVDFTFSLDGRLIFFRLQGRYDGPLHAVDLRLKCAGWMGEFVRRGGNLTIENVDVARLDQIAAEHDLAVVAAGKAELMGSVFQRDQERSVYTNPARNLCMLIVKGVKPFTDGIAFNAMKFNFFAPFGEYFWLPFFHMSKTPCMSVLFEAKEGGPMDRWVGKIKDGAQAVEVAKEFVCEHAPWEADNIHDMELMDPRAFLIGRFAPTVRKAVGRLPSGRMVTCVGDTAMTFDPIGGMGANNATASAMNLVDEIVRRGDRPFDGQWMTDTFDRHWQGFGRAAYTFNNLLLEPLEAPAKEVLISASRSRKLADCFFHLFNNPPGFFPWIVELDGARDFVNRNAGIDWRVSGALGRGRIAWHQLKQKLVGRPLMIAAAN